MDLGLAVGGGVCTWATGGMPLQRGACKSATPALAGEPMATAAERAMMM